MAKMTRGQNSGLTQERGSIPHGSFLCPGRNCTCIPVPVVYIMGLISHLSLGCFVAACSRHMSGSQRSYLLVTCPAASGAPSRTRSS